MSGIPFDEQMVLNDISTFPFTVTVTVTVNLFFFYSHRTLDTDIDTAGDRDGDGDLQRELLLNNRIYWGLYSFLYYKAHLSCLLYLTRG